MEVFLSSLRFVHIRNCAGYAYDIADFFAYIGCKKGLTYSHYEVVSSILISSLTSDLCFGSLMAGAPFV